MVKELKLKNGKVTLVDDEDYEYLSQWNWTSNVKGYIWRQYRIDGKRKNIYLHRLIMNQPKVFVVDHINGDKLDNRKSNLRLCTVAENVRNRKMHSTNSCDFKGVRLLPKGKKKYAAKICVNYKQLHLGCFSTPEEAARAYNEAAIKYHGEFARLNEL